MGLDFFIPYVPCMLHLFETIDVGAFKLIYFHLGDYFIPPLFEYEDSRTLI
jgi:hypothetical protein